MLKKSKTAKFAAGFVAFAFVLSAFATPVVSVKAQTAAELQAQIAALLAQIAALQGQVGGGTSGHTFTTDLTVGSTGSEVVALQQFLVSKGFLTMPAGVAMGNFGPLTQSALANYQAANGISPASGYFGPITRARVNASAGTPSNPSNPSNPSTGLQGGAGSIDSYTEISSYNSEEVGEDQEDVEVAGLEVEVDDGSDIEITAVRIEFATQPGNDDLSDFITEVSVWLDGEEFARLDADEFNDDNDWTKTVSLDDGAIIEAGETADLVVAVTGVSNIDTNDSGDDWGVDFTQVRFVDADGASITDSVTADAFTFDVVSFATANDVELTVSSSSDNPDTQSIEAEDGDEVVLLKGELEAEGSDIEIKELTATTTPTGTGGSSDIASEFILMIDGEEVDSVNSASCVVTADCDDASTAVAYVFDDVDFTVGEGETVDFEIVAVLNDIDASTFVAGDSLTADVDSDFIEAEDETGEDLTTSELSGSINGDAQSFFENGMTIEFVSADADTTDTTADAAGGEQGEYSITFRVTAFGDDVYLPFGATIATSTFDSDDMASYSIEDSNGVGLMLNGGGLASTSAVVSSSADTSGNYYVVEEGTPEEFTLQVTLTPAADGFFRLQLHGVSYNVGSAAAADTLELASPANDFDTDYEDLDA